VDYANIFLNNLVNWDFANQNLVNKAHLWLDIKYKYETLFELFETTTELISIGCLGCRSHKPYLIQLLYIKISIL
jgi:hypothetical protein